MRILYFIFIAAIGASSCSKEKEDMCEDSSSGKLNIVVRLQHHEHAVINLKNYRDTIYVKFNTQDFPGPDPANYDAVFIGTYPSDFVAIPNVGCGNFYLYAVGLLSEHNMRVKGGIPFSSDQKEGEVSVLIPVSEL